MAFSADKHLVASQPEQKWSDFRLSTFPTSKEARSCSRRRTVGALKHVETMSVYQKRIMFATLRAYDGVITADHIMIQNGITVGELTTAQLMFCSTRFSRQPRNSGK